jgi:hypothetical protein
MYVAIKNKNMSNKPGKCVYKFNKQILVKFSFVKLEEKMLWNGQNLSCTL